MAVAKIVLGDQKLDCKVRFEEQSGIYFGTLLGSIEDKEALKFWMDYEDAVNGIMLQEVDFLEQEMSGHSFRVVLGNDEFGGADVDLQIYPSTLAVSFTIPQMHDEKATVK